MVPLDKSALVPQLTTAELAMLREDFVAEIRAVDPKKLDGNGLFFGVNNRNFLRTLGQIGGLRKLIVLDEHEWKHSSTTFKTLGLAAPKALSIHDGVADNYTVLRDDVLKKCTVCIRYWGLEVADNVDRGEGEGDPRAQLLCKALTGTSYDWPYVYVYAQIQRVTPQAEPSAPEEAAAADDDGAGPAFKGLKKGFLKALPEPNAPPPTARDPPPPAVGGGYCFERDTFVFKPEPDVTWAVLGVGCVGQLAPEIARSGGEDVADPVWRDAPVPVAADARTSDELRADAMKLSTRAQQMAALGDHKSAYQQAADAIALQVRASRADETMAISAGEDSPERPVDEGPTTYYPETVYEYPDGTVRTIPAGLYTAEQHMDRTLVEQDRYSNAMMAVAEDLHAKEVCNGLSELSVEPTQEDLGELEEMKEKVQRAARIAENAARARNVVAADPHNNNNSARTSSPTPPNVAQASADAINADADTLARARAVVAANPHDHTNTEDGWDDEQAAVALAAFATITGVPVEHAIAEASRRQASLAANAPDAADALD